MGGWWQGTAAIPALRGPGCGEGLGRAGDLGRGQGQELPRGSLGRCQVTP